MHHQISARWCNGSTTDSGSVCLGSSPGRAAISCVSRKILELNFDCFVFR